MQDSKVLLKQTLSEVLAGYAFLMEDDAQPTSVASGAGWETRIEFAGPFAGSLWLRCPERFADVLVANLLGGTGESATRSEASDALGELMNIVCGHFVTSAYGAEDVFQIGTPESRLLSPEEMAGGPASNASVSIMIENCEVSLALDSQAVGAATGAAS